MAIGVGGGTNQQELLDIASDPDSKFLFELNSFSALDAIKNQLADIVCKGMGNSSPGKGHVCCPRSCMFKLDFFYNFAIMIYLVL